MTTIWKYHLKGGGSLFKKALPDGAEFLHVGMQDGFITLWMLVDPLRPHMVYSFRVVGTGWNIEQSTAEAKSNYLGTVFDDGLVWHIFEDFGWKRL